MSPCKHGWASENYVKCPRCDDEARWRVKLAEVERERDEMRDRCSSEWAVAIERDEARARVAALEAALRAVIAQARPPNGSGLHPVEVVFHMERIALAALAARDEGDK